jgi:environmental stress-induced protein Ves
VSAMRVIAAKDGQRTRWKNDGGWTTEIARSAEAGPAGSGSDHFRWRISVAEIESDGPFSIFPGIARDLLLLEGNGIELDIDDAEPRQLTRRFERVHFDGESSVHCRLLAGPTRDFNVMARRDAVRAEVLARPLVDSMVIFPEAGAEWIVHVFSGHADARSAEQKLALETGSSLHLDFRGDGGARVVLGGAGELVFVKFVAATVD